MHSKQIYFKHTDMTKQVVCSKTKLLQYFDNGQRVGPGRSRYRWGFKGGCALCSPPRFLPLRHGAHFSPVFGRATKKQTKNRKSKTKRGTLQTYLTFTESFEVKILRSRVFLCHVRSPHPFGVLPQGRRRHWERRRDAAAEERPHQERCKEVGI